NTEAVASQAEAVAREVESKLPSARNEREVNDLGRKIDDAMQDVNEQLALLGYYEAEHVEADFNEAFGYMRNAEKKAVKNVNQLFKTLTKALGIKDTSLFNSKGKKVKNVTSNIAPAGGEVSLRIPLNRENGVELYMCFSLNPADMALNRRPLSNKDDLELVGIMYRLERKRPDGGTDYLTSNDFFPTDVTISRMVNGIRNLCGEWLPKEDIFQQAERIAKEHQAKREKSKGDSEKNKKSGKSQQGRFVGDLFAGLLDEDSVTSVETNDAPNSDIQRIFADTVKNDMLASLSNGTKPYRSILDIRKRAKELGMEVDNDGRTDILLQELVEDGLVRAAREVTERAGSLSKESYDLICKLYELQPTISARSSNRIKMQQYSTPLPMAWNAARFAMHGKDGGLVLEPTAGNGMLVFAVPSGQVHANELDETRLSNLREQGFSEVTKQDATNPFAGGRKYDVIISNPPFGKQEAASYDGKMIGGLDPQIALNALSSMKDDGRAAIIIGGNMEYASNGGIKSMKPFFTYLYDHYNVKAVVDMDGSLYAKQGTTFPTRMILIDGRRSEEERAQSAVFPPVKSKSVRRAESFDDLYNIIEEITNSAEKTNGTEILRSQQGELLPLSDQPSRTTDGERHSEQHPKNDGDRLERGRGDRPATTSEERKVVLRGEHRTNNGNGSSGRRTEGNNGGGSRGISEPVVRGMADVGVSANGVGLATTAQAETKKRALTDSKSAYIPHNTAYSLNSVAPSAMVEAMDNMLTRIEDEHGSIEQFVTKELGYDSVEDTHNALAAEQIDSVAMAIYQMNHGQSLIIGDQTGVGKGRQMAALIRWAVQRGEKPVFITQKADLFSDIYRDLVDVGSGDLVPFIFNSDGAMVDSKGNTVHKPMSQKEQSKVFATGKLPDVYDFAVLTYSQVNTGDEISQNEFKEAAKKKGIRVKKSKSDGKPTPKATFLRAIANGNFLFLDESHTAAGTSNTGIFLQSILRSAKAATFASATFAKRPDTMPLYAIRTAMSKANVEPSKLIEIIERGGVTLQEIMSRELTNAGQMVRRERDMSDVRTDWKIIDDSETVRKARDNYDKTITAFNAIIKFQEVYVKPMIDLLSENIAIMAESAGVKRGTDKMGVDNVPFASKTYNYTKQLMLALKVDAIADEVEKEINAGRHPVIALESTMESSIKNYSVGETIIEPTFSASLLKGL
ncbi:MAG: strawberry notch-like NTP hydrolase domain-containing protein, partial [Alloprevotella sp.]